MRKATISFVTSVCPHGTTRLPPDEIKKKRYLNIFRKSVEEIQVSLKSDKNNGYFTWRPIYTFYLILTHFFLEWGMFQTKVVEKIKTQILCAIKIFFNCAVYEITWKNTVHPDTTQITIWHMRITCWIPKATSTNSEFVILIAFPLQQWLHERLTLYVHWLSGYFIILYRHTAI